jgi:hypothetical protein
MSNKVPPLRQPVLLTSICRTKYLLPVNQFCSHQYIEQSNPSPSTSSVVINTSNKVSPLRPELVDGEEILCSTYWWLQNWLTGRGYFVRHIDDYRTGWRGGDTLFDILMTTELVDGEGLLCSIYWWLQNWLTGRGTLFDILMTTELVDGDEATTSVVINMSNKVSPPHQSVL